MFQLRKKRKARKGLRKLEKIDLITKGHSAAGGKTRICTGEEKVATEKDPRVGGRLDREQCPKKMGGRGGLVKGLYLLAGEIWHKRRLLQEFLSKVFMRLKIGLQRKNSPLHYLSSRVSKYITGEKKENRGNAALRPLSYSKMSIEGGKLDLHRGSHRTQEEGGRNYSWPAARSDIGDLQRMFLTPSKKEIGKSGWGTKRRDFTSSRRWKVEGGS